MNLGIIYKPNETSMLKINATNFFFTIANRSIHYTLNMGIRMLRLIIDTGAYHSVGDSDHSNFGNIEIAFVEKFIFVTFNN